jgi:uncharacterized protein YegL
MSLVECRSPVDVNTSELVSTVVSFLHVLLTPWTFQTSTAKSITTTPSSAANLCENDPVDLVFVLDTSTEQFYAEKNFALDLVKKLPANGDRIKVALVQFNSTAHLKFGLNTPNLSRDDVLYEIERIEYTGGRTSVASGIRKAIDEISTNSRKDRRVVVLISDGNSLDDFAEIQKAAKELHQLENVQVYAVTLSDKYYFDELKSYTVSERNIYADERVKDFLGVSNRARVKELV